MRNTDLDWKIIGKNEPYYGVLTNPKFLRSNLSQDSLNEFWSSGENQINQVYEKLQHCFGSFSPINSLDFGCGVGRLVRAMSKISTHTIGVDISEPMLAEARINAPTNVSFSTEIPDNQFDWINSYIVFQHIPPEKGYELFDLLLRRATPNARLSMHFTIYKDSSAVIQHGLNTMEFMTWDGSKITHLASREIINGEMMMYDYNLTKLIAMLFKFGFIKNYIEHTNHGGCHGVQILACKS